MSRPEFAADARVLWRMLRGQPRKGSHADRLQGFYAPQADRYDAFRARLLHGRADLISELRIADDARVVELGCGTGSNLQLLHDDRQSLRRYRSIELVDLCPALLDIARQRAGQHVNVDIIEADATTWQPRHTVDYVYLSYALSMMPDWRAVLHNAWSMLAVGGYLGIVDFHLPSTPAGAGNRLLNRFWKTWFAHDGVHLSAHHLPALQALAQESRIQQRSAPVPYLPGLRAPYYLFVGRKTDPACSAAKTD